MPYANDDHFKESVRNATDIVGLIGEAVTLHSQRNGREFVGLCPFHDDHNPSMRVYADRQSFKCWSCNEGGDCYSFVMKRERIGFREALEMLARRANLELPKKYRAAPGESGENKNHLYEIVSRGSRTSFTNVCLKAGRGPRRHRTILRIGAFGDVDFALSTGLSPRQLAMADRT